MKKLFFAVLGIFLMSAILDSCKDQSVNNLSSLPMKESTSTSSTPARPAVVYLDANQNVAVMDSDGTHQTAIVSSSGIAPKWSPGNSVVFMRKNATAYDSVLAIDIGVNSSGVPVGSNLRTIFATRGMYGDSVSITLPTWSSTSSINKIAFHAEPWPFGQGHLICTISASGGTWDTLHAFSSTAMVNALAWSPDDSKIAVLGHTNPSGVWWVVIMDASTGATTDSISLPGSIWQNEVDWSRASSTVNKLLVTGGTSSPYNKLSYLTPSSGSSPTTNNVTAYDAQTWSPNNSSLMIVSSVTTHNGTVTYPLKKVTAFTGTTTTLVSNFSGNQLNWHR